MKPKLGSLRRLIAAAAVCAAVTIAIVPMMAASASAVPAHGAAAAPAAVSLRPPPGGALIECIGIPRGTTVTATWKWENGLNHVVASNSVSCRRSSAVPARAMRPLRGVVTYVRTITVNTGVGTPSTCSKRSAKVTRLLPVVDIGHCGPKILFILISG